MRVLASIVVLLLSAVSAQAQRHVINGQSIQLRFISSINPDCSTAGYVTVNVTQQPQHGRIRIVRESDFATYRQSNPRSACNYRRVRGVGIYYTAERGYTGYDAAAVEVITVDGRYGRGSWNFHVR